MTERIGGLAKDEIQEIARTSCSIFFKDTFPYFRGLNESWTSYESAFLRYDIAIPTAVGSIEWVLATNPNADQADVDEWSDLLASACDLTILESMRFPEYNIRGVRESMIQPTISDATITAIGMSATRLGVR